MPFITISTLFLLAGVFTAGSLLSWYLCERRNERERARLEESMTRALQQRYQVYEDLEASFHRIFTRMDEIRERWQAQMSAVQESVAGSLGETTFVRQGVEELVARVDAMGAELQAQMRSVLREGRSVPAAEASHVLMRVDNPELWDLEREFERRSAEQLAEISAKSQRVIELMNKIEALEPMALQLAERDREFVTLESEREQLLETSHALEETRRVRVAELSQRIQELELEAAEQRSQVQAGRSELAEREQAEQALRAQVAELERRAHSLGSQVSARDEILADRETRLNELQAQLVALRGELERRARELDERERKFKQLQDAWRTASGQVESQRTRLAAHLGHFHAAQEMLAQLKPMLEALENRLTTDSEDDGLTVVVSEAFADHEVMVDDGGLDELPDDVEELVLSYDESEPTSIDEPLSALPMRDLLDELDVLGEATFKARERD